MAIRSAVGRLTLVTVLAALVGGFATASPVSNAAILQPSAVTTLSKDLLAFTNDVATLGTSTYATNYAGEAMSPAGQLIVYSVPSGDETFLNAMRNAAASTRTSGYVVVPVGHSWAEMDGLTQRIARDNGWLRQQGVQLAEWGPDPASNKVVLSLRSYSQSAEQALIARYGADLISVDHTDAQPATRTGRYNDTSPYFGGDAIWFENHPPRTIQCTSGLTVIGNRSGATFVLTAGHCIGQTVHTNFDSPRVMGPVSGISFTNGGFDLKTVRTNALGIVWSDSGRVGYSVVGTLAPAVGGQIAFGGAVSQEQRNFVVQKTNQCVTFSTDGLTTCHVGIAFRSGILGCVGGDSGGPVYQHTPGNFSNVRAVGIILGRRGLFGSTCIYQEIGPALAQVNSHIATSR